MKADDKLICDYPSAVDKGARLRIVQALGGDYYLEWLRGKARREENMVTKRIPISPATANAHWSWARKLPASTPHFAIDYTKRRELW